MWLSTKFTRLRSEEASAVVGFAVGAPFVLFAFLGFLNFTSIAWKGVNAEVRMSNLVRTLSLDSSLHSSAVEQIYLDDLNVYVARENTWKITKVVE